MAFDTYLRFIMVLVLVIGMIAFIAWLVRRLGLLNRISPGSNVRGGKQRLAVIESCPVDSKRRLVLVRRDRTEHLLLLTGTGSGVVIERGVGETPDGERRKRPSGRKTEKSASARRREEQEWEDDSAAEDDSVTRVVGLGKSARR